MSSDASVADVTDVTAKVTAEVIAISVHALLKVEYALIQEWVITGNELEVPYIFRSMTRLYGYKMCSS